MSILTTGFAAFPGAPENPTLTLMRELASFRLPSGEAVETLVLPVEWNGSWACLRAAIDQLRPRAVLMFGLHAGAERLRIELRAHNERGAGRPDAAGVTVSGPIEPDGPSSVEASLPLSAIMAGLRTVEVDFELSRDPGRYLCNDSLYRLCRHAPAAGLAAYGFVHVPLTDAAVPAFAAAGVLPTRARPIPPASLLGAATALLRALASQPG